MSEYKIRRVFWGATMEEVRASESWNEVHNPYDGYISYEGVYCLRPCRLDYYFDGLHNEEKTLREITYWFKKNLNEGDQVLYKHLEKKLIRDYGQKNSGDYDVWVVHEGQTSIHLTEALDRPEDVPSIVIDINKNIRIDGTQISEQRE